MYLSAPSTYMSSPDPRIVDSLETVIADTSTGKSYTPSDFQALFEDTGLPWAREIADYYIGFLEFAELPVDLVGKRIGQSDSELHRISVLDSPPAYARHPRQSSRSIAITASAGGWARYCWYLSASSARARSRSSPASSRRPRPRRRTHHRRDQSSS